MSGEKRQGYINPIPYIDAGKEFEMRLTAKFTDVMEVGEAKLRIAEYIKSLPVEQIVAFLSCTKIKAVYPERSVDNDRT